MKYNTYIFDLDGTLLNTLNDLAASCNYALRTYGLPEHSVDDVRRFVGNGVRLLMTRAIPGGESYPKFEECYACFRQHYLHHNLDTTAPYPGIMEMLGTLLKNGKNVAVVSNKFYQATQDLVHHFFPDIKVAIGERPDITRNSVAGLIATAPIMRIETVSDPDKSHRHKLILVVTGFILFYDAEKFLRFQDKLAFLKAADRP